MELGLYGHIDHRDQSPERCEQNHPSRIAVSLGNLIPISHLEENSDDDQTNIGETVELIMAEKGYYVRVNNRGIAIRRDFTLEDCPMFEPASTKVRKGAFFGGNECAPHEMRIFVNDIKVDHMPDWWDKTDYKGYANSVFYAGEEVVITAKEIELAPPVMLSPDRFVRFEPGTKVRFRSYNQIDIKAGAFVDCPPGADVEWVVLQTSDPDENTTIVPSNYDCPSTMKLAGTNQEQDKKGRAQSNNSECCLTTYPNPFEHTVTIEYSVIHGGNVTLKVFNMFGKLIREIMRDVYQESGIYQATFDGSGLATGVYYAVLESNDHTETKSMILK